MNKIDISRIIEMAWEDRTPFEAIEATYNLSEKEVKELMNDKSYSFTGACCQTLENPNKGGEIGNGLGLSFATGYGDGSYPIYAYYEESESWGKRVKKIEIEFITDDDLEEDDE